MEWIDIVRRCIREREWLTIELTETYDPSGMIDRIMVTGTTRGGVPFESFSVRIQEGDHADLTARIIIGQAKDSMRWNERIKPVSALQDVPSLGRAAVSVGWDPYDVDP